MATVDEVDSLFIALARYSRLRDRALNTGLALGVTGPAETAAYRALFNLRHRPMRSRELAELLVTDPSTTSRHVAQLVAEGLVTRVADPDDGRAVLLVLTDDGRAKVADIAESRRRLVGRTVEDWSDDDFTDFVSKLTRFVDAVESQLNLGGPNNCRHLPKDNR